MLIMTECYRFPGEILTVHIVFIDIHILHNEHSLLIVTKISYPLATKDVPTVFSQIPRLHFDTVCQAMLCILCSSYMGTSDLPEIYTRARGRSPSASVYISGKSKPW